jgi:glycogen operon protein
MIHLMMNAYWEDLEFEVPSVAVFPGYAWKRWIDTFRDSPEDICSWDDATVVRETIYKVQSRSLVVLVSRLENYG